MSGQPPPAAWAAAVGLVTAEAFGVEQLDAEAMLEAVDPVEVARCAAWIAGQLAATPEDVAWLRELGLRARAVGP